MSNRLTTCPHCGNSIQPKTTEWNFSEWKITTQFGELILKSDLQAKILDLLWRKQGMRGLTRERIVDIIYMNSLDSVDHVSLTKVIHRMRADLISVGIWIQRGYTGGEGYSLIFMTPEQARKKAR